MKLLIVIALILALAQTSQVVSSAQDYIEKNPFADKIRAAKCVLEAKSEIQDLVQLYHDIQDKKVPGSVKEMIAILKRVKDILHNCGVFFCYGPTYKKCQEAHPQGCEKWGLIVYPKCKEGYTNWDCCVCANICPQGFRDDGLYCAKPAAYGRGAGYALWRRSKCESKNPQGCEKWGAIWYPKCRPGFHNVGCCICSPNCPSGFSDIGVSCKKPNSYGRGVGYPITIGLGCLHKFLIEENMSCDAQLTQIQSIQSQLESTHFANIDADTLSQVDELTQRLEKYDQECSN